MMKQLLVIATFFISLIGFSQEKGTGVRSSITIKHINFDSLGNGYTIPLDYFRSSFYDLHEVTFGGSVEMNSSDSLFYEVTLQTGDSLEYIGDWTSPSYPIDVPSIVYLDSVVTVLSGAPFTLSTYTGYDSYQNQGFIQKGVIRSSCLLEIKAAYITNPIKHYVRITFVDQESEVLDVPMNSSEINIYQKDENSLFISAAENALLDIQCIALSGQLISKSTMEGSNSLDISSFPQGYYIIQVKDSNGAEKRMKFVR